MKQVLVIANNLQQASFRVRIAALEPRLAQRGIALDVKVRPKKISELPHLWRLLRSGGDYHAVILQRKLLEPWEATLLRKSARHIFFDVDDAVMFHNRPVGEFTRWRTGRRFAATTRAVDHVVAGNDYLAEIFRRRRKQVTVLPTMVDAPQYAVKRHEPTDSPRLVWIGSSSTIGYLEQFLPAIEEAARLNGGLRLLTIGDRSVRSSVLPVEHEPWSQQTEAAALLRGDIGIAPTPRDEWTMGKCGYKLLQYMSAGLPVIASPVGANAQIVQDGVNGLLGGDSVEWPGAIARLASDATLRKAMGRAGREFVEEHFALDHAADIWAGLLSQV